MNRLPFQTAVRAVSMSALLLAASIRVASAQPPQPRQLSFAERVAYQYAIEDVYWRHRIWPKENPGPKPSLDEAMSPAQIRAKVQNYLRNSQLLADYWQRPITPEQTQAEMDRMASHTKQPEVLQELFAALGNEPFLVAECLARPVLAERLVKNLYAHDERIHGELKRRAESELRACRGVEEMKQTGGTYSEIEWIKTDDDHLSAEIENRIVGHAPRLPVPDSAGGAPALQRDDMPNTIKMTRGEWAETIGNLAAQFGGKATGMAQLPGAPRANQNRVYKDTLAQIETGVFTMLQEYDAHYYATAVIGKGKDRVKIATVAWSKESFESWAAKTETHLAEGAGEPTADYVVPEIASSPTANPSTGCTDNSWAPMQVADYPSARWFHTAVWTGSEMIVWGGTGPGGPFDTGGRYNPTTNSWLVVQTTNAPSARYYHTAVWTGSEMVVWGGTSDSTGGRYNPSTDTWVATTLTNAPTARTEHTAVWTGSEMIVWGGSFYTNTGGRYNPSADSWVPTNITNAPSQRSRHTAVWTGSEMIVWGGYSGGIFPYPTDGGRYQPSTDSWTATNMNNAPGGREILTSVWTGTEMIVWGGWTSSGGYTNTGGRYNPSSDSWSAVPVSNAPTARRRHSAVWSGNEMIVWGGYNGSNYLNSGGRYNPSASTWIATNGVNAPSVRGFGHTAVWTGTEMIIWGGWNGSVNLNTGGRYTAGTDSWLATNTTNAPGARDNHSAIWTGSQMIVWGGDFYDGTDHYLNTGGRYNPNTDSWISTTTTSAPSGRDQHSAVWTGSEMIVWGGYDGFQLNTGGRNCVQPAAPVAQSAASRKIHGLSGIFNVDLPLTGAPGIECRAGGATNDYSIVVTFGSAVTVNGSPQAQVMSGTGTVGSGGVSNGGMVTISGDSVTVPLTNVTSGQTINVRLNNVTGSSGSGNITIPMSILIGDSNANGAVNSADVAQAKARLGQTLNATNFRSDVNANGVINSADVSQIKSLLGTGLP